MTIEADSITYDNYSNCKVALDYIMRFTGQWYKWGGDDPSGFDCSGLVVEYLQAGGKIPRKSDFTADQLMGMFPKIPAPRRGGLVFFGKNGVATHVEICLNNSLSLGASGGGKNTVTVEDAMRDNAFIKVRPITSRSDVLAYNDPWRQ